MLHVSKLALHRLLLSDFVVWSQTGNKNKTWAEVSNGKACWIAVSIACGLGILSGLAFIPVMRKHIQLLEAQR